MAVLAKSEARELYDRIADRYDLLLISLKLFGLDRERERLIEDRGLVEGDHVVNLCAGTGVDLPLLVNAVGPTGRGTAVDLSLEMLARAKSLAQAKGWTNIDFVQADVETYAVPDTAAALLSAFGLEMVPDYEGVLERAGASLEPGALLGLMGLKHPEGWPDWLVEAGIFFMKPFGVSRDYSDFRPWEAAQRFLIDMDMKPLAFGAAYRCVGLVP